MQQKQQNPTKTQRDVWTFGTQRLLKIPSDVPSDFCHVVDSRTGPHRFSVARPNPNRSAGPDYADLGLGRDVTSPYQTASLLILPPSSLPTPREPPRNPLRGRCWIFPGGVKRFREETLDWCHRSVFALLIAFSSKRTMEAWSPNQP